MSRRSCPKESVKFWRDPVLHDLDMLHATYISYAFAPHAHEGFGIAISVGGALAMSALVFAGSSQFIAVGMIAAGTVWLLVVLTALIVNLRHLLYAASLVPHVKGLSQRWKVMLGFWLTDELFAIAIRRYEARDRSPFKHNAHE